MTGAVVVLEDEESKRDDAGAVDVADKIVVIPKADPGYDWIFAKESGALLRSMVVLHPIWRSDVRNSIFRRLLDVATLFIIM